MSRVVDCLTLYHDHSMVALAALVCVLGCLSTALVAGRAMLAERTLLWAVLLGASFGATAWSTHFIAMLAYRLSVPITYAVAPTLLSLVVGLGVVGAGFGCALAGRERLLWRLVGGALVGAGVLGLHFIGMQGLRFAGDFSYVPSLVLVSVTCGIAFGATALGVMFAPGGRGTRTSGSRNRCIGAMLLLTMTVSLHFVAMGAVEISLGFVDPDAVEGWPRSALATSVVIASLAVLSIGVGAALLDRRMTSHLSHLARHDALTDLPNRRYFGELFVETLTRARRTDASFSVFAIDLDDFKSINDVHGHAAGDTFIRTIARRISGLLKEGDFIARLGGDEFAIVEHHVDDRDTGSIRLAARVHEALALPVSLGDVEVDAGASIGIARFPRDGDEMETLLREADTAMYRAKERGKGMSLFFEPSMNAEIEARRRFETRLRVALGNGSLSLAYQPLVDSGSRRTLCCEALLRWDDEELGRVSPETFIPVAESTGLIVPIGDFVLDTACRDAMLWPDPVRVAINISVVQFTRGGIVESVRGALARSGLPGRRLELEITESLLLDERERTLGMLAELRALGVEIAMDDFGTGYSSLGYLQNFRFGKLKIDRSFVSDIEDGVHDASIVRAAIAMGRSLGMRVVAEGVETELQAELLAGLDCDELQGYLIARPMPIDAMNAFLAGERRREDGHIGRAA